jgi:hypothetical protein
VRKREGEGRIMVRVGERRKERESYVYRGGREGNICKERKRG